MIYYDKLDGSLGDEVFLEAGCGGGIVVLYAYVFGITKITAYDQDKGTLIQGAIGAFKACFRDRFSEGVLPSPDEFGGFFLPRPVEIKEEMDEQDLFPDEEVTIAHFVITLCDALTELVIEQVVKSPRAKKIKFLTLTVNKRGVPVVRDMIRSEFILLKQPALLEGTSSSVTLFVIEMTSGCRKAVEEFYKTGKRVEELPSAEVGRGGGCSTDPPSAKDKVNPGDGSEGLEEAVVADPLVVGAKDKGEEEELHSDEMTGTQESVVQEEPIGGGGQKQTTALETEESQQKGGAGGEAPTSPGKAMAKRKQGGRRKGADQQGGSKGENKETPRTSKQSTEGEEVETAAANSSGGDKKTGAASSSGGAKKKGAGGGQKRKAPEEVDNTKSPRKPAGVSKGPQTEIARDDETEASRENPATLELQPGERDDGSGPGDGQSSSASDTLNPGGVSKDPEATVIAGVEKSLAGGDKPATEELPPGEKEEGAGPAGVSSSSVDNLNTGGVSNDPEALEIARNEPMPGGNSQGGEDVGNVSSDGEGGKTNSRRGGSKGKKRKQCPRGKGKPQAEPAAGEDEGQVADEGEEQTAEANTSTPSKKARTEGEQPTGGEEGHVSAGEDKKKTAAASSSAKGNRKRGVLSPDGKRKEPRALRELH